MRFVCIKKMTFLILNHSYVARDLTLKPGLGWGWQISAWWLDLSPKWHHEPNFLYAHPPQEES